MNPYFQQQQLSGPPMPPLQYAQQNFQPMQQAGFAQQNYRVPNPFQQTTGWAPQPYLMPGYQYPFNMGQIRMPVPTQQQPTSQAVTQTAASRAPPLPSSNRPPEPAPLPPPPDNIPFKPAPPPPDEEPSNKSRPRFSAPENTNKTQNDSSSLKLNDEQKPSVNYKTAISSLAASKQSGSSNEDLETLQNQQKELENQMKKYQSEYEKWFKEFTIWKKQHESHPDQRKYIEYQQKYQKLIEQQQQALKQQYLELQNRIKKKKEHGISARETGPYLQPNIEPRQREEIPQSPVADKGMSRSNFIASNNMPLDAPARGGQVTVPSHPVQAVYQPQISPIQQSRENFAFQGSHPGNRPNQEQQGFPLWQEQEKQKLPVSHGSSDVSKSFDNINRDQYKNPTQQQSNLLKHQGMQKDHDSMRHQGPPFHQSQSQYPPSSQYQDHSKPQRTVPQPNPVHQTVQSQIASSQPHTISQNIPMNSQTNMQSQGLGQIKHQGHQSYQSYSENQGRQGHYPPHGQATSKYQSSHHLPYQNQKSDISMESQRFQNQPQQFDPLSQQPHKNLKSDSLLQGSYNQQQSFPSHPRKPSDFNRTETQQYPVSITKDQQNCNPQGIPSAGRLQPSQHIAKNKPIPSLMSQEIPKKDYYDATLQFTQKDSTEGGLSSEGQRTAVNSQNFGAEEAAQVDTSKEINRGQLRRKSMDALDFTSDDMTGIEDWENGANKPVPPPLSPRSKMKYNDSYNKVETSSKPAATPPKSISHPTGMVAARPVQQSHHGQGYRIQQPHQSMHQQVNNQLQPRSNQHSQIRPFLNKPNAPSVTPRSVSKQQGTLTNETNQTSPRINSAPPVEPPSDSYKVVPIKHGANAPDAKNIRPQFSQRASAAGQRMPRPLFSSSSGALEMKRPDENSGAMFPNIRNKVKLPSLIHQYQTPSNIPSYKKMDCRNFPNCKFKASCHNRHPQCPDTVYCENDACIYDHPQLTREEISDIKLQIRNQKAEVPPSNVSKEEDAIRNEDKPQNKPNSNLPRSGEGLQQRGLPDDYRSGTETRGNLFNRDRNLLSQGSGHPAQKRDPSYHDRRGNEYSKDIHEDYYRRGENYEDQYYQGYDMSSDRPFPHYPSESRLGEGRRGSIQRNAPSGFHNEKNINDGRYVDYADATVNEKNIDAPTQSNRKILSGEGAKELKNTEKKGSTEGAINTNAQVIDREKGQNIQRDELKLHFENQPEVTSSVNRDQREGKGYTEEAPRHPSVYDERVSEPNRGGYWGRYPVDKQHPDDYPDQYYDRESDWAHMQARSRDYEDQNYQDRRMQATDEDYDGRSGYYRDSARDEWERLPARDDFARPLSRDDSGRYARGGDVPRHDDRDHLRDYPARAAFRDRPPSFGELHRPVSPPRRESFREQVKFERRYRDWERQHFPIDDPTREWEFELRRRELLGASQTPPVSAGYRSADPPRDYPPYEREDYGRPPFDTHLRNDQLYSRDPYLDRPRDVLRPAVFDYDHSRKVGLYDVDPWKLSTANPENVPADSNVLPRSPVQRTLSPRPSSPQALSLSNQSDSREVDSSSGKRRLNSSVRSRSPGSSRGPRRGSSPRREDVDRSSRSLQERSRSPPKKSDSPSRRSSARRSPSPRRRRSSPSQDRRRSREDSRSRDRSDRKDHLTDIDRRISQQDQSYRDSHRILHGRRSSREPIEETYYSRYGESRLPEITPIEPGPDILPIQDLLDPPGRNSRPKQIVVILRGPPGCGKTHIAKIIKDKEVSNKAPAPRILALDDYFIQETDVYEKDPDTGKRVKVKKLEYVYEEDMEAAYRVSLLKSFNKTLDNGYFPMIIIDAINDKVEHFQKFWSDGKHKGFEVYIAEMHGEAQDCAEKNIHDWTQDKIQKMLDNWESTPNHFKQLDVRSLVQDAAINEVEMEEVEQPTVEKQPESEKPKDDEDDLDEEDLGTFHIPQKSKWEETKDEQLAKLDGISHNKKKRKATQDMFRNDDNDDYYDDDPYDEREEDMRIGKKRVRWADIEEKKELEHRKRIGFCIGTDWSVLTDPNAQVPL